MKNRKIPFSQPTRRDAIYGASVLVGGALNGSLLGCASEPEAADTTVAPPPTREPLAHGVYAAPDMPEPYFIETNGIRMGVYDTGGSGKPVVFSHGFPELAYSWRHQVKALEAVGYRAIASDQRGYGLTERPEGMENYTLPHLCADMAGLLDALELETAIFCGHDWGGGVVWMMPRLHPERVAGVIGVNTPTSHPAYPTPPEAQERLTVESENYYTRTFQEPGRAEAVLEKDVRASFEYMMRKGGIWNVDAYKALPEDSPERQLDLLRLIEENNPGGELLMSDEELDYFVETFEATGFTGGLNWYRATAQVDSSEAFAKASWDIEVPCLYVGAEHDVILRPASGAAMAAFLGDFENHTIADCGHWTQQEKPEELNAILLDWLGRKA